MKYISFQLLLLSVPLAGLRGDEDVAAQARVAQEYVEARDYDEALRTYEIFSDHAAQPWENQAIQYNTGNVLLLSGKQGEALHAYNQVEQLAPFPELAARLAFNRAVAEMVRARSFSGEKGVDDAELEVVRIGLWREAVEAAQEAERALCSRDKELGAHECIAFEDIASLKQAAQEGLSQAIEKVDARRIADLMPEVGVPTLQMGVAGLIEYLQVLSIPTMDPKFVKSYQEYYASVSREWQPLWENLEKKITPPSTEFTQAEKAFADASNQVASGDFSGARQTLEVASRQLQLVMDGLYSGKSVAELLQVLLAEYTQSLARGTVDKHALQVAIRQMKEVEKKVDPKDPIYEPYHFLYGLNDTALEMVKSGDESGALIAVQGAEISVRMMLAQRSTLPATPKAVIKQLIQDQHGLLGINRSYQSREESAKLSSMLARLQGDLLVEAGKFPQAMKLEENEQWKRGTFQGLAGDWEDISSLFDEGYSAAQSARDLFTASESHSEQSISYQMLAFDDWMNALALLEKMKAREQDLEAHPLPSTSTPSTTALMQQLEGMEQDDKSLSAALQSVTPEKVEKPW